MKRIIISRTDNIGDVVLTLPMAGALKKQVPDCFIIFLGKEYVRPVIETCLHVDAFLSLDEILKMKTEDQIQLFKEQKADIIFHVFPVKKISMLAYRANIPLRIGTSHRIYNWFTCNKNISLGRKKSNLHEAQLNLLMLEAIDLIGEFTLNEIHALYGMKSVKPLPEKFDGILSDKKPNVILHPTSKGSAREWGIDNFSKLVDLTYEYANLIVSGTGDDAKFMAEFLKKYDDKIFNVAGKMDLSDFIILISKSDCLVAASTGPLHIAAALGIKAIGLYAPMRPIHPGRWSPIGEKAEFLVIDKVCNKCRKELVCECIREIDPQQVKTRIFDNI